MTKKMRFLGHYSKSDIEALENKPITKLLEENQILSYLVKIHSNPFNIIRYKAIKRKKFDPAFEPFLNGISLITKNKNTYKKRRINAFMKHASTSNLLLQYLLALTQISLYYDKKDIRLTYFHKVIFEYFKESKIDFLLYRKPMAYTWKEKHLMMALLQIAIHSNLPIEMLDDFWKRERESNQNSLLFQQISVDMQISKRHINPLEPIKCPRNQNLLFGKDKKFYDLSIYEYGHAFWDALYN
ncbi:hypothetical protein [Desulfobacter sp. UBA2225]|uniref:hypothetical protein n=1 Tax=Desulfobacter sp. UBA2225 TaxID=1961413 RepID=UPI002579DD6B|nr:hypothetical protein [Desulfobacter sp. UBA2225]